MADNLQGLKNALGFSVSMIASEHWISASMSSPWSVAKFAQNEKDAAQIWKLFTEAAVASVIGSLIIAYLMQDGEVLFWSLAGAGATLFFVGSQYQRALQGSPMKCPHRLHSVKGLTPWSG